MKCEGYQIHLLPVILFYGLVRKKQTYVNILYVPHDITLKGKQLQNIITHKHVIAQSSKLTGVGTL